MGGSFGSGLVGLLLLLTCGGLLSGVAVAIWADQTQRDADGYLTTSTRTFHSDGSALEFETVDLPWSDNPIAGEDVLGLIRIRTLDWTPQPGAGEVRNATGFESFPSAASRC